MENRALLRQIDQLFAIGALVGSSDQDLLDRFASRGEQAAFEALMTRHGPMVLGVCRRIIGDVHLADDAFQAVFLIMARKAGSIRQGAQLGTWLHGVARRVALRARNALKNRREVGWTEAPAKTMAKVSDVEQKEALAILDQEIAHLPAKYRELVVLCYLEGLTHDETAHRLGLPVGTIHSRLAWSRRKLRSRLERGGVAAPVGLGALLLGAEGATASALPGLLAPAVAPTLLRTTLKAAIGFAAGTGHAKSFGVATELARRTMGAMIMRKLTAGALAASLMIASAGALAVGFRSGVFAGPRLPANGDREAAPPAAPPSGGELAASDPGRSQAQGRSPLTAITVETEQLALVRPDASRRMTAYSAETGEWKRYELPNGLTAQPVANKDLLVFSLEGETIDELAAFDAGGDWHVQRLKQAVKSQAIPIVGTGVAVYSLGRYVYAYSSVAHRWDMTDLGEETQAQPALGTGMVHIEHNGRIHTFSVKLGRWSMLDASASAPPDGAG